MPALTMEGSNMTKRLLLAAVLISCLSPAARTQTLDLPDHGDAYRLVRGPSVSFAVLRASDGFGEERLRIDHKTPNVRMHRWRYRYGARYFFSATLDTANHGKIPVRAELDIFRIPWPRNSHSYHLVSRITSIPRSLAVSKVGVELEFADRPGEQAALVPVFSGGVFVEPHSVIPNAEPIDTGAATSVQATAYYGDDGSGLIVFIPDRRGTEPKRFFYESRNVAGAKSLRMAVEFVMPNTDVGGGRASMPHPACVRSYRFDPKMHSGWYKAASIYRSWVEIFGRGRGGILEKGPLKYRRDVPKWMKEIDLLISEQYGWFPELSLTPNPLLAFKRQQLDLGAKNVWLALWTWNDRKSDNGRVGSYYPIPQTVAQVKELKKTGIYTTGYTNPTVMDIKAPPFDTYDLDQAVRTTRTGVVLTSFGGLDFNNQPIVIAEMDVASRRLSRWFRMLGMMHSTRFEMSGFYSDAPVLSQAEDWKRDPGLERGVTEAGVLGYKRILSETQYGARLARKDFVQFHESAFEWLIPNANAGQGAVGVIGRAYKDEQRTFGVPFFQAVYSGYTSFWPADEGLGTQTLLFVPDAYGPYEQFNMSRLLVEGVTWGGVPNSSEILLGQGVLFYELPIPGPIGLAFAHHKTVLKNMIALRAKAREWLVYGRLMPNPVHSADKVNVVVKRPFDGQFFDQTFPKLAAPTEAWRARDGSIRIVSANGGVLPATVTVDLARLGRRARGLRDTLTNEFFPATSWRYVKYSVPGGKGRLLELVRYGR